MPRPDTGNFNRFLTSLGLLFLAASLIVPYFYFQSTDTLMISAKELSGLSETGRSAIENRQSAIAGLEIWVAIGSSICGLGGVALLVLGGLRLRRAQESEEEEGELRKERTQAEIRQMSPERVAGKRDEQARGAMPADVAEAQVKAQPEPEIRTKAESAQPARPSPQRAADRRYRERREAIVRIEEKVDAAMSAAKFESHDFFSNISVDSAQANIGVELDGLFEARDQAQHDDIVLEITLFDNRAFKSAAHLYVQELVAKVARYQAIAERSAIGWFLAVVPDGKAEELNASAMGKRLSELIDPLGVASLVEEKEIPILPARLAAMIELEMLKSSRHERESG